MLDGKQQVWKHVHVFVAEDIALGLTCYGHFSLFETLSRQNDWSVKNKVIKLRSRAFCSVEFMSNMWTPSVDTFGQCLFSCHHPQNLVLSGSGWSFIVPGATLDLRCAIKPPPLSIHRFLRLLQLWLNHLVKKKPPIKTHTFTYRLHTRTFTHTLKVLLTRALNLPISVL